VGFHGQNPKKMFIPFVYDEIQEFSEGLCGVKVDEKWKFVDKVGKSVPMSIYENVRSFNEGLCGIEKDGKYGFIDKTGKEVIPFIYNEVGDFSQGLVQVKKKVGNRKSLIPFLSQ